MKTRKLFCVVVALFAAVLSLGAAENALNVTRDFDVKDFTGIDVSGIVKVELRKSDAWKVSVTLPEAIEKNLYVKVKDGELKIGLNNVTDKLRLKSRDLEVIATIYMPVLYSLEMSGATSLRCYDSFDLGNRSFKLEMSGAAKAEGLEIYARRLDLEMGGATVARLEGVFDEADIEAGGAAKCECSFDAGLVTEELSGAAKVYHTGEFGEVKIDASGASVGSFKGTSKVMRLMGSGASKIDAFGCVAENARVVLSGASYCELNALFDVEVDLSSGASLRYKDNPDVKVEVLSIGRAASLKKVK